MLSKKFAYLLFGIIAILSVLFGYNIYTNYQKNQKSEEKINTIINKFEEKFKADSIYLAKANKMLIDKISQKVIDSVSNVYEEKLKIALNKAQKYKELLIANNITLTTNKNNSNTVIPKKPTSKLNVISYKQLTGNLKEKQIKQETNLNITTYSKIAQNKSKTTAKPIKQIETKHKPSNSIKPVINSSNKIIHNNYLLDHAKNIHDIDQAPIFPGCENNLDEKNRKNCFATKISRYILDHFNTASLKTTNLKKGLNKVRVLFIVDKNGYAKFGKLIGQWPDEVYKEAKRVVESTPKMIAGKSQNKNISVKYSLLIPFVLE